MVNKIIKNIMQFILIFNIFFTVNAEYVRPEASSYSVNNYSVQNMFNHNYDEKTRVEKSWFINRENYEKTKDTLERNSINNKIKNLTMGVDALSFNISKDKKLTIGLFAGMGSSSGETKEISLDEKEEEEKLLSSKHFTEGYSAGINGNYTHKIDYNNEFYIDSWALGGYFKGYVKGRKYPLEKYNQMLFLESFEIGSKHKLFFKNLCFNTKMQIGKSQLKSKDYKETNFTRVKFDGNDNTKKVFGLKLFTDGIILEGKIDKELDLYMEYNYTLNYKEPNITMNEDNFIAFHDKKLKNVKAGASILFEDYLYLYSNLDYTVDNKNIKRSISSTVGFRYLF